MGTQQSRQGHGRQGSRQQGQQSDQRPQQERDMQHNKQSDRGQQPQQGSDEIGHRSKAGMGMTRDEYRDSPAQQGKELSSRDAGLQQSPEGGGKQTGHRQENEGGRENRQQASERRQQSQQNVYGEGNYAASRQYNDATKDFAQSGRVEPAARAAAPRSASDAREMQDAEAEGKRHAKGEDPALDRKPSRSSQSPAPRPGKEDE